MRRSKMQIKKRIQKMNSLVNEIADKIRQATKIQARKKLTTAAIVCLVTLIIEIVIGIIVLLFDEVTESRSQVLYIISYVSIITAVVFEIECMLAHIESKLH